MKAAYKAYKIYVNNEETMSESLRYVVRIEFPSLTNDQFDKLMAHYGGDGGVKWSAGKTYSLVDFLPPKMQALVDHWLYATLERVEGIPSSWQPWGESRQTVVVATTMNCWDTAYSTLFDWHKPVDEKIGVIAHIGPLLAAEHLTKGEERPLSQAEMFSESPEAIKTRNEGRKPGDVLYITTPMTRSGESVTPAHVAIWIDNDLYFEKTNAESLDPIRLATYEDVVNSYLAQEQEDEHVAMSFYRYRDGQLPPPSSFVGVFPGSQPDEPLPAELANKLMFSMELEVGSAMSLYISGYYELPLVRGTSGRYSYQGAERLSQTFRNPTLCWTDHPEVGTNGLTINSDLTLSVYNTSEDGLSSQIGPSITGSFKDEPGVEVELEWGSETHNSYVTWKMANVDGTPRVVRLTQGADGMKYVWNLDGNNGAVNVLCRESWDVLKGFYDENGLKK